MVHHEFQSPSFEGLFLFLRHRVLCDGEGVRAYDAQE